MTAPSPVVASSSPPSSSLAPSGGASGEAASTVDTPTDPKDSARKPGRMERLLSEYGPIAIGTYLTIFGLTWAGFATAISLGVSVESAAGGAGLFGASWLATKVTQPLRIGATAMLTPVVASVTRRRR